MKLFHSSSLEGGSISELPQREIPAVPPAELQPSFHCHFSPTSGQWLSKDHACFAADGVKRRERAGMVLGAVRF